MEASFQSDWKYASRVHGTAFPVRLEVCFQSGWKAAAEYDEKRDESCKRPVRSIIRTNLYKNKNIRSFLCFAKTAERNWQTV